MPSIEILRSYRLLDYAIFDLVLAYFGMYILSFLLTFLLRKAGILFPRRNWLFLTLPIGIIGHVLVGSITPMTEAFFDIHDHYVLKIIILGCIVMGFRNIKRISSNTLYDWR